MRTRDLSLVIWAAAAAIAVAVAESESEGEADGDGRNLHEVLHNPYRSRGASLVYKTFHHSGNPEAAFSYFYDDRIPIPANLRRQRQFVSEPVVLPTTRFAPQTRQEEVKALPSRPQARPGFFFSPVSPAQQQSFVFPPPPPPPPQAHSSSLFQQQQPQQSFQQHQFQLLDQQRQQQLEQQRQQRELAEQQQIHAQQQQQQQQQSQLLVPEQPQTAAAVSEPPAASASAPITEQSPQQQPSLSPFRLQDAVTTTASKLLFPTTSFAEGTHLKPVPAVPQRLSLTTDHEEQRSAPPTTETSFAQIRLGAPSGPTVRPAAAIAAEAAAAAESFSRPVVNVRSRQTTLTAARPVTAPPTAATEKTPEKRPVRVRKPVRKVRKLKPVVHIVPVSTAAPLPPSTENAGVPTAPTAAPTAASRSPVKQQPTGFRALRSRLKGITGLRGRLHHHGNSDNKLIYIPYITNFISKKFSLLNRVVKFAKVFLCLLPSTKLH